MTTELSLFPNEPPNEPPAAEGATPLAHRLRPATLDEFLGHEQLLGEGKPLRAAIESGVGLEHGALGAARLRQDHARAPARALHGQGVRELQRRDRGRAARARDHPRGRAAPTRRGPRHDSLLRRDPSLQSRAAGRVPAVGRGRGDHADRRDDREPVVRAQLRASVTAARVRARAAVGGCDPRDREPRLAEARARGQRAACRSRTTRSTCSCGTPTATRAAR